ncbi:phBC6A51 family helix-turn-helix protein [Bacteroides sp. 51]|uniref:phBC6A51 family helix-turn-helix protein n=1 Tax=Bacteroides sp. 51 TaxID=2302938 RepID=UPI0013D809FE|nr:phBC6A51 family helix-turn-helix protein [Bacteroides sp. 51]NDV81345.1 hypothetical protein [Bacteroides sp. 51]
MAKYSKRIVEHICELISADSYTIAEVCKSVGISERTYYDWLSKNADFADAIKKAKDKFIDDMLVECEKSLSKLIKGYTAHEKRTVTVDTGKKDDNGKAIVKVKEHVVTEKHFAPSLGAIIHFQTNRDPDNWKNRQENKIEAEIKEKGSVPIKEWLKKFGEKE